MASSSITWTRHPADALADSRLADTWDLLNKLGANLPFLDASSMRAALRSFGTGREALFVGNIDSEPAAMFVLSPQGPLKWQTFQPSQIPLGCWVAAPRLTLPDTARSLLARALPGALVLSITQIDPRVADRAGLPAAMSCTDYIDTAWLDLQGNFETYWAGRGKNLRQNLRKQRNRLAADGTRTTLRLLRDPQEMAGAVTRYGQLESTGWKSEQGTAIHPSNAQGRFYTELLEQAALRGEALVSEYLFDDRTAAMNLGLLRDGQWIVLKTTYDESLKAFSPASLLREEELQTFFAKGPVRRIEYFGRVMEWHTRLTDQHRTLYHLTTYRWAWLRHLATLMQALRQQQKPAQKPEAGAAAEAQQAPGQT